MELVAANTALLIPLFEESIKSICVDPLAVAWEGESLFKIEAEKAKEQRVAGKVEKTTVLFFEEFKEKA
jgi:hypothetical protein